MRSYFETGVVDKIRAADGEIYAITSEPQFLADQAREHWKLPFETIGDPHQEIPRVCDGRSWLTLYANRGDTTFIQRGAEWVVEHPKGFFQPGVLALSKSGRILYRWRSVPSPQNLNGTVARPRAEYVWKAVDTSLAGGDHGGDAAIDENPSVDSNPPPRILFIAALIANGWFIKAQSFIYSPGVDETPQRFARAFKRWPVFIAVWILAYLLLPSTLVTMVLLVWIIWISRDIKTTLDRMDVQQEIKKSS